MTADTYDMTVRVTQGDQLVFDGRGEAPGDTRAEAEGAMRAFWTLFHKGATVEVAQVKARPRKAAAMAETAASQAAAAPIADAPAGDARVAASA